MKRSLRSHGLTSAFYVFGGFLILCWLWSLVPLMRGRLAAQIDMQRGRYQVLGYGLPSPWRPEYLSDHPKPATDYHLKTGQRE